MNFATTLESLPSDEYVSFSRWDNLLLLQARTPEPATTFELYEPNIQHVLRKHPRGLGIMLVVHHDQPPPEGYSNFTRSLIVRHRAQLLCVSVVIEARGFGAAIQRGVGMTVLSASGMNRRFQLHRSIEEAVPWVIERTQSGDHRAVAASALLSAIRRPSAETAFAASS